MPYTFLEETATADIAFHAEEASLEELFKTSGDALMNVMVSDIETIRSVQTKKISLYEETLDLLLFDFLQELVFFKDAEQLLLRASAVSIERGEKGEGYFLKAELKGEIIEPLRHEQRADVKAVTLHQFKLEKSKAGWEAFIILDI